MPRWPNSTPAVWGLSDYDRRLRPVLPKRTLRSEDMTGLPTDSGIPASRCICKPLSARKRWDFGAVQPLLRLRLRRLPEGEPAAWRLGVPAPRRLALLGLLPPLPGHATGGSLGRARMF